MDNNNYNNYDNATTQQDGNYQQSPYGQPYNATPQYQQPYNYYQQPAYHPGKSYAIAGMILGIVSFFLVNPCNRHFSHCFRLYSKVQRL